MVLSYEDGALALHSCAIRTSTPQQARIDGTDGSIEIPDFWHATRATLAVCDEDPIEHTGDSGYHFEAAEVMACLRAGKKESSLVPLDESIAIAAMMDRVREQIGLVYPMEES
jgi:predicted dehydrogenase